VSGAARNADAQRGALAVAALGCDRAAMQLHEVLHQGEPDAGTFIGPAAGAGDAVETLEQFGQLIGRDAGAGVADGELEATR